MDREGGDKTRIQGTAAFKATATGMVTMLKATARRRRNVEGEERSSRRRRD
jgi:hypothetical protein